MSLTEASMAGLLNARVASSSISDMFIPPRAAAWAEAGSFRKLNEDDFYWASDVTTWSMAAKKSASFLI